MYPALVLRPGKEKAILNYHHWIFSGAVKELPDSVQNGELVEVKSASGEVLGCAYINRASGILGRMVSFGKTDPLEAVTYHLNEAKRLRDELFQNSLTNAYRIVNAEGDRLPGLVIDRYADIIVVQCTTLGMEKLKPMIIDWVQQVFKPKAVYEKSTGPTRKEEGLRPAEGLLFGALPEELIVRENDLKFIVDIPHGQKTGYFLDQQEMRQALRTYTKGKKVLNTFSYSGGFSLSALKGGAAHATSVDISPEAVDLANKNAALNGFTEKDHEGIVADVFEFLRHTDPRFDVIVLDPPAFAKHKKDVVQACRGYKDINRLAFKLLPKSGILFTSSCSQAVDEQLFQTVVFQAAREANRTVRIIGRHAQAPDHPINIYHPEGEYLKSLILFVS